MLAPMTDRQTRQLLDVAMYYLPQDIRRRLMIEAPAAYNAYCGREVVSVTVAGKPV